MASPSTVLTLGFGSWGSAALIPTLGFGVSQDVAGDAGPAFRRGFTARGFLRGFVARVFRKAFGGTMRRGYADLVQLGVGETRTFCFDFSNFPEVVAGETLSAPDTPPVAGVTFGTPTVLAAPFVYDEDGNEVPSGKGVKVNVTGGAPNEYTVRCVVTASGGGTLILPDRLKVVAVT